MEELDFLTRRYRQLVPAPREYIYDSSVLRRLTVWLNDDVIPAVDSLAKRPAFRAQASWVIRSLAAGSDSSERREIELLDEALVECAKAQTRLLTKQRLWAKLQEWYRPTGQQLIATELTTPVTQSEMEAVPTIESLEVEVAQVRQIAGRYWSDLVNMADYFEPQQQIVECGVGKPLQVGTLIVSLNPELRSIGNFLVRTMLHRIESMLSTLRSTHAKLTNALQSQRTTYIDASVEATCYAEMQTRHSNLRSLLVTSEASQLRDACVVLTQLLSAFHPNPDIAWLGMDDSLAELGQHLLRSRITGLHNGEFFERIAASLSLAKRLYVDDAPDQSPFEEAIAAGGLVIDGQRKEVFWNAERVAAEWGKQKGSWQMLHALAVHARRHADISEHDLGKSGTSLSAMATANGRLGQLLPASLRKLILPGRTARTYRLDLEPQRIYIRGTSTQ